MQLSVKLKNAHYPIIIQPGILGDALRLPSFIKGSQVLIVSNETIAPLYLHYLTSTLSDFEVRIVTLPDGEQHKNQHSLNLIYDELISNKFNRDATLIALGGGVIGDVCGFAAATYQRGVHFIQVPTTLLAQVDASVGGKTAINHPMGKNLIGSFYQPDAVIIDTNSLLTLTSRELSAGMAEIIKYAFISDKQTYDFIEKFIDENGLNQPEKLSSLIYRCCEVKARFVVEDEKEQGIRAILNFGHTYAHALELVTGYTHLLHGEAVAIGMYCAIHLSVQLNLCHAVHLTSLQKMLRMCGLTYTIPKGLDVNKIMEAMLLDKKILNNKLRLVLLKQPGQCFISDEISVEVVKKHLLTLMNREDL